MAKKNTAHRPSQSTMEYVTMTDGRKVRNTAYIPPSPSQTSDTHILPSPPSVRSHKDVDDLVHRPIPQMATQPSSAELASRRIAVTGTDEDHRALVWTTNDPGTLALLAQFGNSDTMNAIIDGWLTDQSVLDPGDENCSGWSWYVAEQVAIHGDDTMRRELVNMPTIPDAPLRALENMSNDGKWGMLDQLDEYAPVDENPSLHVSALFALSKNASDDIRTAIIDKYMENEDILEEVDPFFVHDMTRTDTAVSEYVASNYPDDDA